MQGLSWNLKGILVYFSFAWQTALMEEWGGGGREQHESRGTVLDSFTWEWGCGGM